MSYTELDHLIRCVDSLSADAIAVLGVAHDWAKAHGTPAGPDGSSRIDFDQLRSKSGDMDPSLLMGLVGELLAANLLHLPAAPPIRMPNYGNYPAELTPLGTRFVEKFLTSDS